MARDDGATEFDRAFAANGLFLAEENGDAVGFVSSWLENNVAWIGDPLVPGKPVEVVDPVT